VVAAAGDVLGAGFFGFGLGGAPSDEVVAAVGAAPSLAVFGLPSLAEGLPSLDAVAVPPFDFFALGFAGSPHPACGAPGAGGLVPV
jgi:hypothetical protein